LRRKAIAKTTAIPVAKPKAAIRSQAFAGYSFMQKKTVSLSTD
jgi:hypothetical protein